AASRAASTREAVVTPFAHPKLVRHIFPDQLVPDLRRIFLSRTNPSHSPLNQTPLKMGSSCSIPSHPSNQTQTLP
ncbi:Os02g0799400, partial [Oryza sativa Japonica Group]